MVLPTRLCSPERSGGRLEAAGLELLWAQGQALLSPPALETTQTSAQSSACEPCARVDPRGGSV